MKAVVYKEVKQVAVEDIKMPRTEEKTAALLKIASAAIHGYWHLPERLAVARDKSEADPANHEEREDLFEILKEMTFKRGQTHVQRLLKPLMQHSIFNEKKEDCTKIVLTP